ncbi:hypothetical protein U9M48_040508 [Paspalum notatum var. saurae]|uniref:Tyrosinase copper-binding domain-containing protein n=1 Tax=Paspalum notatum var. saurae TaxID=547442 RepID=A0AAQ3XCG4_PASNO
MNGWMASACWLLWLVVAAGLTRYPGLTSAAGATDINDQNLNCDPSGKLPCPPLSTAPIVDFKTERSVKRIRQPVHRLSRSSQEKYKLAVARMKALPASHPLSFTAQAAIHQAYCDGHYRYDPTTTKQDGGGGGVGRPFDVHSSCIFAPWHRIYIYFYERALAELVGDDTFALPYWSWDAPEGMVIPPLFRDAAGNNSLYDEYRNQANLDKLVDLDYLSKRRPAPIDFDGPKDETYMEAVNSNLCTVYDQQIRNGKGARNFLGGLPNSTDKNTSSGTLEQMAHTAMHVWTGRPARSTADNSTCAVEHDGSYNCRNDMAFLGSAGRDPLFYSHHANVDRLWHIWATTLCGGNGFSDPAWLDASFVFYDGVRSPRRVRIKFRDVLDTTNLGYTYAAVAEKPPFLSCNLTSLVPGGGGGGGGSASKVAPAFPLTLKGGEVVEVPGVALPAAPGQDRVLVIDRVEYDPAEENKFDVAINVPKESAAKVAPQYKEYAGCFSVVPSSVESGGEMEAKVTLAIDQVLADVLGAASNATTVDVVIVPRTPHAIKLYLPPTIQNTDDLD